jgi:hypothetical protein
VSSDSCSPSNLNLSNPSTPFYLQRSLTPILIPSAQSSGSDGTPARIASCIYLLRLPLYTIYTTEHIRLFNKLESRQGPIFRGVGELYIKVPKQFWNKLRNFKQRDVLPYARPPDPNRKLTLLILPLTQVIRTDSQLEIFFA